MFFSSVPILWAINKVSTTSALVYYQEVTISVVVDVDAHTHTHNEIYDVKIWRKWYSTCVYRRLELSDHDPDH